MIVCVVEAVVVCVFIRLHLGFGIFCVVVQRAESTYSRFAFVGSYVAFTTESLMEFWRDRSVLSNHRPTANIEKERRVIGQ